MGSKKESRRLPTKFIIVIAIANQYSVVPVFKSVHAIVSTCMLLRFYDLFQVEERDLESHCCCAHLCKKLNKATEGRVTVTCKT